MGITFDWETVKAFFDQHPDREEEKPGLYLFLLEADWRERYGVTMDEAEYLVQVDILGEPGNNPHVWAHELERYRENMKRRSPGLEDDERKIIQHYRLFSEEEKKETRNFVEYMASKKKLEG